MHARCFPLLTRFALVLGLLFAGPALARDLTGSVVLREDLPLPDGVQAEVQVWAATGETAHLALSPDGQPPFDFALAVADSALLVQAMIRAPDGRRWISGYTRVPAGPGNHRVLDLVLDSVPSMGFSTALGCGAALVQIGFAGNDAFALRTPLGQENLLAQMKSVGAERNTVFSDGRAPATVLDVSGPLPRLVWVGKPLPPCIAMPDPATSTVALHGQDGAWSGRMTAQGKDAGISITLGDGSTTASRHALPWVNRTAIRWYSPGSLEVSLLPGPCRVPGHPAVYPAHVDATVNDKRLFGCAGEPASLLQGGWQLLILNGKPLSAGEDVTLSVRGGALSATTGCNVMAGLFVQADPRPLLTLMASTRKACPEPTTQTEAALLAAFAQSTGYDMDQDGRLLVLAGHKTVAIFRRQ